MSAKTKRVIVKHYAGTGFAIFLPPGIKLQRVSIGAEGGKERIIWCAEMGESDACGDRK